MTPNLLHEVAGALRAAKAAPEVFLSVTENRALQEAAAADARQADGAGYGPLDGATVSWKDMISLAGVVLTAGSRTRLGRAPEPVDAPLVTRGARAGLVTIGSTNLSEFAFSGVGQNPHFGTPLSDGKIPGGSSSGAAAAVARRIVRLAVGTDTAGSCRIPAAFHGLFGFRPTQGRYPMDGVLPLAPAYDTVGLITGTVQDLRDLDAILAGDSSKPDQPAQIVLDGDATDLADPLIARTIRETLKTAAEAGFSCHEVAHTTLSDAIALIDDYGWPGGGDAAQTHAGLMTSDEFALVDPLVATRLEKSAAADPDALSHVRRVAVDLRTAWPGENTILALPTVAVIAPDAGPLLSDPQAYAKTNTDILRLTMAASLMNLPALTLPVGRVGEGQWCGLQLVGAPGSDRALLTFACVFATRLSIRGCLI